MPQQDDSQEAARPPETVRSPFRLERYWSRALGREQPYALLTPHTSDGAGDALSLLVLLHGRDGRCTDWPNLTRIARRVAGRKIAVVCPEGDAGWYTNAVNGGARYEDDIVQDLLPHLQSTLPLAQPGVRWAVAGLSMGGYGAMKLALKHPNLFSIAASHSGSFDKPTLPQSHPVFGDPSLDGAFRHRENVYWLAEQAMCRFPTDRPRLFLDCGLQDDHLDSSRRFRDHLSFLGYPIHYAEMPGYHTWPYWDRAFRTVLPEVARLIGA